MSLPGTQVGGVSDLSRLEFELGSPACLVIAKMADGFGQDIRVLDGSRVKSAQCYESLWFKISAIFTAEE